VRAALITGLACFLTQLLAQHTLMLPAVRSMALLWPPNVVLFAALMASPLRRWWLLVAASLSAGLVASASLPMLPLLAMSAANAMQAILGAGVLRALGCGARELRSLKGIVAFVAVGACLSPLLASLVSAALLYAGGWTSEYTLNWTSRFLTNAVSMLTLGPPILVLASGLGRPPLRAWLENAMLLLAAGVAEAAASSLVAPVSADAARYLPLPFLLWAAVRGGVASVALVALTLTLVHFFAVTSGPGATGSLESLLSTQLLVIAITIPSMVLAVIVHRWRSVEGELRASHERHRLATAAGRVGAWDWDATSRTLFVDPVLKNLLGYEDHEIPHALEEWQKHVYPADRALVSSGLAAHIETGAPFEVEYRMIHKDGGTRWIIARGRMVGTRDKAGGPRRMTGTCVDVTERRRMEDAMQIMKVSLDRAARAKNVGTVATAIAHELSQPLFAIVINTRAALQLLESRNPDIKQAKEALEDIAADSARANQAIHHTRELFESPPLERQSVSIERIIHTSLEILKRQVSAAEIVAHTEFASDLSPVWADPVQLQQVFDNLLSNSIAALQAVERFRHLWVRAEPDAEHYVKVSLRDSGCGVDPRYLERIFDPFFSTRLDGLGLGLTVARSIVAAHGGKICASANRRSGMLFEVWLQAATPNARDAPNPPPPPASLARPRSSVQAEESTPYPRVEPQ
jgi:two-component system sensor kinase FixL